MKDITLKEVKQLLQNDTLSNDEYIQAMIPISVSFVRDYCENPELKIDGGVKIAVAKIIEFYMSNSSLQSKSLSRVSETFHTELPKSILQLLSPYNKKNMVKFL